MQKNTEEVIKDLKDIFDVEKNYKLGTRVLDNRFFISKNHIDRFFVISNLQKYFETVTISDGYLEVKSITLVNTKFEIKKF